MNHDHEEAEMNVSCTLTGDDLAAQARRWRRLRAQAELARTPVGDGLLLRFRDVPGVEEELIALVAAENRCCAWADWQVSREGDSLVMRAEAAGVGVETLHRMLLPSTRADVDPADDDSPPEPR
jgi:hypothetical protein